MEIWRRMVVYHWGRRALRESKNELQRAGAAL